MVVLWLVGGHSDGSMEPKALGCCVYPASSVRPALVSCSSIPSLYFPYCYGRSLPPQTFPLHSVRRTSSSAQHSSLHLSWRKQRRTETPRPKLFVGGQVVHYTKSTWSGQKGAETLHPSMGCLCTKGYPELVHSFPYFPQPSELSLLPRLFPCPVQSPNILD